SGTGFSGVPGQEGNLWSRKSRFNECPGDGRHRGTGQARTFVHDQRELALLRTELGSSSVLANGGPDGRTVIRLVRQPVASRVAATSADKVVPMLRIPTISTVRSRLEQGL